MIKFIEEGHIYTSVVPDQITWLGVTTLIGHLHEKFDSAEKAPKSSTRRPTTAKPNKWYGVPEAEILKAWEGEKNRAAELGHWYHNMREQLLYAAPHLNVHPCIMKEGIKMAPPQRLVDGIYPEHLVYLASAGICGQSDLVEVVNGRVNIRDYKTSKEIRRKAYVGYDGTKRMHQPVGHLEDCEFTHYALQLSIYMYIILRHNPSLMPGDMIIEHVKFEIESEDKHGYPIYRKDDNGNFIVREIEEIKVPYLKGEVMNIIDWLKIHKQKLIK